MGDLKPYERFLDGLLIFHPFPKISDEGGGIARSSIGRIWSYTYTTAREGMGIITDNGGNALKGGDFSGRAPLAGLGY
jgi:pyruvate dehydrogenase kinase 2/3/4